MNRARRPLRGSLWTALSVTLAAMLLVSGCGTGGGSGAAETQPQNETSSVAEVELKPGSDAEGVNPTAPVKVSVQHGRIENVTLKNGAGEKVEGKMGDDGASWKPTVALGYDKTYTWSGKAVGEDGKELPIRGSFTTLDPDRTVRATINPIDNETVGIAMPISIKFDAPVQNKAAAERALKVEASKPVEGSWAWLTDKQVDWRPKEYWPAHTEVDVEADLYGVRLGKGEYGTTDLTTHFTIGRSQIVKANVDSHRMIVMRGGEQVANYPASYGKPEPNALNTPNGTYMVMAKHPVEIMDNPKYGYTDVEKKWAVRISNHGEFIHENENNKANIGKRNTSHGCVNLTNADAKKYFDSALIGDPVEVTGASKTMPPRYAVYDWMLSWQKWKSMSAL
ncbi:lipoprotein-anchoring transpeptidase ErfK/SrfK [Saccharopolyspora lacisalsi]|uniref:Lipoprotein-anchoring transpeptidase ErfK/SrfK n=1 Tax=Halosaccharopolyspora lacisalsi TaxID=1000566 RepID=A0A839E289_9PSEU|nr:Ig-like domain-containing protein [Halosaccharopolyspora lacisalsi]MBA8827180.1 lipoprotein-anchoring transpeptidase ErfK/SrfK [Halosaccharopolyspora lacisalsi]